MARAEAHRAAPPGPLTYEEFLAWCDEDTWAEWVNGEVVMLAPASDPHQDRVDFLTVILRIYTEVRDLGKVRSAPFQMKTGPDLPGREPDLLFVTREHLDRLRRTHLDGPADVTIEVTCPESRLRDRGEKFAEYEAGGVREYWIIDPDDRRADFFRLDAEGRFQRVGPGPDGIYRSEVVTGFWLKVDWLWQESLPPTLEVLQQLGVIPPLSSP
jgi:Uma2 family endonuclease